MKMIEEDDWSQQAIDLWDVYQFQNLSPCVLKDLLQLTCGTLGIVYQGSLLNTRVLYFDPPARGTAPFLHLQLNLEQGHRSRSCWAWPCMPRPTSATCGHGTTPAITERAGRSDGAQIVDGVRPSRSVVFEH
eukprot:SAG25_NODE_28_length_20925_cov_13.342839_1_plen_132_part_00